MKKILHLVAGDLNGGAARGAYSLHIGLKELGWPSKILNNSETTQESEDVVTVANNKTSRLFGLIRGQLDSAPALFYKNRKNLLFSTGFIGYDFLQTQEYQEADIIHLHWINQGFVDIKQLGKVKKPLVWTMRDMWSMTGGCHVAGFIPCDQYKSGCGHCKQLGSSSSWDLSRFVVNRKKQFLPKDIHMVGISYWLSEQARSSEIFRDADIRTIYNNVSSEAFAPVDKILARELLGISTAKKIILACAHSKNVAYKGFDKFLEMLELLDPAKYLLCFFGTLEKDVAANLRFEYKHFGYLHDNVSLRLLYSSADVFVAPSLIDAFGKTIVESMACGTPVVCFDATGPSEIIDHQLTGYKASPYVSSELAEGVEWLLGNENSYQVVVFNARQKVLQSFDVPVIARQYAELYNSIA